MMRAFGLVAHHQLMNLQGLLIHNKDWLEAYGGPCTGFLDHLLGIC